MIYHLNTSQLVSTLFVERLVLLGAIQDALVTSDLLCDMIKSLDDAKTQLLSLFR
jgi:hypothetical protein